MDYIVKQTRVIASAIIIKDSLFLVLKRSANSPFAPGRWEFVSGFMGEKETVESCLLREIKEEISLKAKLVKRLATYESEDEDGVWVIVPYLAHVEDKEPIMSLEHDEYKWVNIHELILISELAADAEHLKLVDILREDKG